MVQIIEVLEIKAEKIENYYGFDYLEKISWDSSEMGWN